VGEFVKHQPFCSSQWHYVIGTDIEINVIIITTNNGFTYLCLALAAFSVS
jgi:hypothetical protein